MKAVKDTLRDLLEEKFEEKEFQDCFIVDILISKNNKVQVFVDCDHGVTLSTCTQLSRYLEAWLDESLALGEKYTLEVSSPGVDRPLIRRQYKKNTGRKIRIKTKDGKTIKGLLEEVEEDLIRLKVEKSKKESIQMELHFEDIEEAKIIVSF